MLADRDRGVGVDGQPPDRRAEPVGPDDQVVAVLAAVVEGHQDRPVQVLQRRDRPAHPDGHALAQDLVEVGPGQGQAGPDVPPQPVQVDLGQQPAVVVEQPLMGDGGGPGRHRLLQPERPQGADAVGGQVHAGPGGLPAGLPLDQLGREPGPAQRPGQRQPGQPGPHHQDPRPMHGHPSPVALRAHGATVLLSSSRLAQGGVA